MKNLLIGLTLLFLGFGAGYVYFENTPQEIALMAYNEQTLQVERSNQIILENNASAEKARQEIELRQSDIYIATKVEANTKARMAEIERQCESKLAGIIDNQTISVGEQVGLHIGLKMLGF